MTRDPGADGLAEAFWGVARRFRSASLAAWSAYDVTPGQVRAVRVLSQHGGVRASELAQHLHIAPRSATEVVDALEAKSLAVRRPDPGDRRATIIELTERGRALSDEVRAARGAESERLFGQLSATDRGHLARILRKLSAEEP